MSLEYCERTDIGLRRANNQDAKAVLEPWSREQYRRRGWLFVVADGMGAHAAGEMASAIAAEQVPLAYEKLAARSPPLALFSSIRQANAEIHARGESSPDLKGMGTTCTAVVIGPRGALVGHVGDSRAYRVRRGLIEQLSRDHSLAWEVEEMKRGAGVDDPTVAHTPRNIITRSLGPHGSVDIDIEGPFPVEAHDVFVLCSDGLSGQVEDAEIGMLAEQLPPADAAAALVGLALVRGGPDNITVIAARAGEKEVSSRSAVQDPWPLSEQTLESAPSTEVPWRELSIAATALLAALVFLPANDLMGAEGLLGRLLGDLRTPIGWVLCIASASTAFIATLLAVKTVLGSSSDRIRVLRAGELLGKGPYRNSNCRPSIELIEGIVTSVESAADGLRDGERADVARQAAHVRQQIAAGDLPAAVSAAAATIAIYTRSVEDARRSGTSG